VKLGVIADSHVSVDRFEPARWHNDFDLRGSRELLGRALEHDLLGDAEAVFILGDLAHFGDRASIRHVVEAVDDTGRPAMLLQGNHDVLVAGVRLEDEVGRSKFVSCPFRSDNPDAPLEPFRDAGLALEVHEVRAELTAKEARWPFHVERRRMVDAPDGRPVVVATHFPVLSLRRPALEAGLLYSGHLSDLADSHALALPQDRPAIVLSGHLHLRGVTSDQAVLQIAFAALIEAPHDVAVVQISEAANGDIVVEYECASIAHDDVERVPVVAPPSGAWEFDAHTARWAPA
jgi:predicted phosphodiesterase